MDTTALDRRRRIYELMDQDPEIQKMMVEYKQGRKWFERATRWMPPGLHSKWWNFPGMGYFIYHRVLTLVCENMRFPDEEVQSDE